MRYSLGSFSLFSYQLAILSYIFRSDDPKFSWSMSSCNIFHYIPIYKSNIVYTSHSIAFKFLIPILISRKSRILHHQCSISNHHHILYKMMDIFGCIGIRFLSSSNIMLDHPCFIAFIICLLRKKGESWGKWCLLNKNCIASFIRGHLRYFIKWWRYRLWEDRYGFIIKNALKAPECLQYYWADSKKKKNALKKNSLISTGSSHWPKLLITFI